MKSENESIVMRPIGTIHTPFPEAAGTPIQAAYAQGAEGTVLVHDAYAQALDDVATFERIWLIYWMDRVGPFKPRVIPYRDNREHGLFATRSPGRPNPIGMTIVRLLRKEGQTLYVADVDMLDNTPLLDIKPYVPEYDAHPNSHAGWYEHPGTDRRHADNRFHDPGAIKK